MKGLSLIVSLGLAIGGWQLCSLAVGTMLVPSPMEVGRELLHMVMQAETWLTLAITVARGAAGLLSALICALVLGIATGSSPTAMRLLAPLAAVHSRFPV